MYSVIGLLSRPPTSTVDEWRTWWTEHHVPKVLALPGLMDYVIWPIDEELNQVEQSFGEPSYAGVAIITFESKQAFLDAFETPEGHDGSRQLQRERTQQPRAVRAALPHEERASDRPMSLHLMNAHRWTTIKWPM